MSIDAESGYIHTTVITAANVADSAVAADLIREDDHVAYGNSAYCAVDKHREVQSDPHLSKVDYRTNKQKPCRKCAWNNRGFIRFLTGGTVKVSSELYLLAILQNIVKAISKCNTGKLDIHLFYPEN